MQVYYKAVNLGNGSRYEGTGYDLDGNFIFHGNGKLYGSDGKLQHEGFYVDGKLNGKGKWYLSGFLYYTGDFLNGKPHGLGARYDSQRERLVYEGEFRNGIYHGRGKSYSTDGSLLHTGIFINGDYYEGDFVDGNACGKGRLYAPYKPVVTYAGDMKDDEPNGIGISYYYDETPMYEGEFVNGLPHGKGRKYLRDGKIQEGIFVRDFYYVGEVSKGKASGKGRLYNVDDNLVYEGDFSDGLEHGAGKRYSYNGELLYEGAFVKGLKHGKGAEYRDGFLWYEGDFKDGQRHGKGVEYQDGFLWYEGDFKDGQRHGKGAEYQDGFLWYEGDFKDGWCHGKGCGYAYGELCYKGDFQNGKLTGMALEYEYGILRYEGNFMNGKWHGLGREYAPDGTILREGLFDLDQFVRNAPFVRSSVEAVSLTAPRAPKPKVPIRAPRAPQPIPKDALIRKENPCGPLEANSNLDDCLKELNELIGLASVKEEINSLVNRLKLNKERIRQGLSPISSSNHLVFTGNPGTGKTTVARMLSKIFKVLEIVSKGSFVETDRAGLVGGYIGQTALKTEEVIDSARGGVLFIDEAYALTPKDSSDRDFGREAIDTLLNRMENYRDDLVVVVAGYDDEMERFLNFNPGLKSRFPTVIHFPNYTPEELMDILLSLCTKNSYKMEETCRALFLEQLSSKVQSKNFSNGRYIQNLFEKLVKAQANRLFTCNSGSPDYSELTKFTTQDVQSLITHNEFEETS